MMINNRHPGLRPSAGRVFLIKSPAAFPDFRFEWHPEIKRVYLIRLNVPKEEMMGEPFAFDIDNEGAAYNAVLIFLRGYRAAQTLMPAPLAG